MPKARTFFLKFCYISAAFLTVGLVIGVIFAWIMPSISRERLKTGKFTASKAEGTYMMKAPASIQSRAGGNTMFTLFQGDTAFQNIPSVGGLAGHPTAAFHVNHKGVLYINKPLYDILQTDGRPLEMGVDIGGTVREWSRPLIPLTVILAALWLLGLLLPAGSDIQNLTRTSRLPALDSLRGVAAVVVLLHHAIFTFYPPQWFSITFQDGVLERAPLVMEWIKFSPIKLLFNGQLMVIIFWILSGLVLSMPILAKECYPKIAQAAAKRYFRLMPVAAFTVMTTYFLLVTDSFWHGTFSAESGYMVPSMVRNFPGEPELVMALKDALVSAPHLIHHCGPSLWSSRAL